MLDEYLAWLHDRGLDKSAAQYGKVVRSWLVDSDAVLRKIRSRKYAPKYRHHLVNCIQSFARFGRDEELLAQLADIRLPPATALANRDPLTDEEFRGVREFVDARMGDPRMAVVGIMAMRGLRCGDVLRLPEDAVHDALDTGELTYIGKGEKVHRCQVQHWRKYLESLATHPWPARGQVAHLLCPSSPRHKAQDSAGRMIRRAMDEIAMALDIDRAKLHPHRLRHTHADQFLRAVRDRPDALLLLRDHMGHSSVAVTERYLRRDRAKEIASIEDQMNARP